MNINLSTVITIGIVLFLFVIFVYSLCAIAADADERMGLR